MASKIYLNINLTFIFLICFASFYTATSEKILQKITCEPLKFVKNSTYFSQCYNEDFSLDINTKPDDLNLANCITIYGVIDNICLYISKIPAGSKEIDLKLPINSSEFDTEINKLKPKDIEIKVFLESLCKNISSLLKKLSSDQSLLESTLKNLNKYYEEGQCEYTCHSLKGVSPSCMVFLWANKLIESFKVIPPLNDKNKSLSSKVLASTVANSPLLKAITEIKKTTNEKQDSKTKNNADTIKNKNPSVDITPQKTSKQLENHVQTSKQMEVNDPLKVEMKKKLEDPKPDVQDKTKADLPLQNEEDKPNAVAPIPLPQNPVGNDAGQEEDNPDNDLPLDEDHLNKKGSDDDVEAANDHENIDNDLKEPILDDKLPLKNLDEQQHGLPQDLQKPYGYSSLDKEKDESHFFTYFSIVSFLCIGLYIGYHNKQKILAIALEGRRGSRRGRGGRRRPSTANYRKLDCNLEEAVTSQCSSNATHVIY